MTIEELTPGKSIRLQLSGGDDRASTAWCAFSSKKSPDMYVSPRMMGGDVKISLHASGSFNTGVVSEKAVKLSEAASRHWDIWKRSEDEIGPKATRAWYLLIPDSELRVVEVDPKARVLPPVGPGHAVSVEFLLCADVGPTLVFDDAYVIARFDLAAREESCLIVARRIPWPEGMIALAERARAEALAQARASKLEVNEHHRLYIHGKDVDGVRFGLELAT